MVGLGNTGISVAHYLQKLGFNFAIIDSRDKPPLMDEFFQQMPDTPVFTGGFDEAAFKVATHLVVSPGVSLNEKSIIKAIANGAKIVSDIDLFACSVDAPIIAITGSNGKSTVTTMLGEMAKAAGNEGGCRRESGYAGTGFAGADSGIVCTGAFKFSAGTNLSLECGGSNSA